MNNCRIIDKLMVSVVLLKIFIIMLSLYWVSVIFIYDVYDLLI